MCIYFHLHSLNLEISAKNILFFESYFYAKYASEFPIIVAQYDDLMTFRPLMTQIRLQQCLLWLRLSWFGLEEFFMIVIPWSTYFLIMNVFLKMESDQYREIFQIGKFVRERNFLVKRRKKIQISSLKVFENYS